MRVLEHFDRTVQFVIFVSIGQGSGVSPALRKHPERYRQANEDTMRQTVQLFYFIICDYFLKLSTFKRQYLIHTTNLSKKLSSQCCAKWI